MIEKISSGPTFEGSFAGFGLFVAVVGLFIIATGVYFLAAILIFLGVVVFLSVKGVLLDMNNKRIMSYNDFIIFKTGIWDPLDDYDRIGIYFTNQSQAMHSRGNSTTVRSKYYEVVLVGKENSEILLKEFNKLQDAEKFVEKYSKLLGKESFGVVRKKAVL